MQYLIVIFSFQLFTLHVPDLAEIMEHSDGAVRVHVLSVETYPGTRINGELITVEIIENLWGEPPVDLLFWAPLSACGSKVYAPDMIAGYKKCNEKRKEYLGLPPEVYLLCGTIPADDELCSSLKKLKHTDNWEDLVSFLKNRNSSVRQQCFRKLKRLHLNKKRASTRLLNDLTSKAPEEGDMEMIHNYLETFHFFKHTEAMPFVFSSLINRNDKRVAVTAETAFQSLAGSKDVSDLIKIYYKRNKECKKRFLRALAPRSESAAVKLVNEALKDEQNVLPILESLHSTGRRFPSMDHIKIKNKKIAKQLTEFYKRVQWRRTIIKSGKGKERNK